MKKCLLGSLVTIIVILALMLPAAVSAQPPTQEEIEQARQLYPQPMVDALLFGIIPSPEGFDSCVIDFIGQERLDALRSGEGATGHESNMAAVCLLRLDVPPETLNASMAEFEEARQQYIDFISGLLCGDIPSRTDLIAA